MEGRCPGGCGGTFTGNELCDADTDGIVGIVGIDGIDGTDGADGALLPPLPAVMPAFASMAAAAAARCFSLSILQCEKRVGER